MEIHYSNKKNVKCYRDYVQNPDDRAYMKSFVKMFGAHLLEPAKKLHDRLVHFHSAGAYNKIYGSTDNRIELKQGVQDKEPLILKVRIGRGPRKFFYHHFNDNVFLLKKDWTGDFNSVTEVYVIDINNHDYKSV